MTNESRELFIRQLEETADNIGDVPRHELQILLRRAALRLRNVSAGAEVAALKEDIAKVMDEWAEHRGIRREDAVNEALADWAISIGMMEPRRFD